MLLFLENESGCAFCRPGPSYGTPIQQVALDCELGCPSVSPPTPDLYILDAIDPATAYYSRLKAGLILHMIEVKLQPADLQDSLGQLMRPIALHVREEDVNLR